MKKLLLLIPLIVLSSCASKLVDFALKKNGVLDTKAVLQPLEYDDKKIVFLNMVHLGTKEYYADVKSKIDSLQKEGFFVMYEGLYLRKSERIIKENDTVNYLKFRKVMGIDPLVEYSKMKPFSDYIVKYDLLDQPDYPELGITSKNSKAVDLPMSVLISELEKEKGIVQLSQCDYNSKLGSGAYTCGKVDKDLQKYMLESIVLDKRNKNIVEQIKQSSSKKIVVVYGKNHYSGIQKMLQQ